MDRTYEDYEEEYAQKVSNIRRFLASKRSKSTLNECERLLADAKHAAIAMQGLALLANDSKKMADSKRRLETEIQPLSKEVYSSMSKNNPQRKNQYNNVTDSLKSDLFGSLDHDMLDPFDGNGRQDDNETERLIRDSEQLLRQSQSICADSEQIGATSLQTMGSQREQLQIASGHLDDTMNTTQQAGRVLKSMSRRALRNKICLYGVILFLIVANCFLIYRLIKR